MGGKMVEERIDKRFGALTIEKGFITKDFTLEGQTSSQFPQPVQSKTLTCILKL